MNGIDLRPGASLTADVLVIGGGAAGVAAAFTARQYGLDVVLAERYGFCGGGAVAGMSGTLCGMYEASDDTSAAPKQTVFGFLDRFVDAMDARGGLGPVLRYGKTFTRVHDPLIWREVADGLLIDVGVRLVFHATAIRVLVQGGERVEGAVLWTKQGLLEVRAPITIDASGDADITAMAGLPTFVGDNGRVQNPTMIFRLQGVDVDRFLETNGSDTIMGEHISQAIRETHESGHYQLPRSKIWLFPTTRPGELLCNCTRIIGPDGRELNPLIAQDFTDAETQGRLQVREYARFLRDKVAGCENSWVNDTGVQVGVRQTRQVLGTQLLRNTDILAGSKFSDGIARSPWPIELHAGARPRVEWLLNDVYEIPYGCFVPQRGDGLLAAGRCISAEHEAVASARVTAQCFSYGHAVGHAAAICVKDRMQPRALSGADLRNVLNGDGAQLN